MRLLHYGPEPISGPLRAEGGGCYKPKGFWFSVEGAYDWKWWCEGEGWAMENLVCVHEVKLKRGRVLRVRGRAALKSFDTEWARDEDRFYAHSLGRYLSSRRVRWDALKERYDGLIIAPYIWAERLGDLDWYYGWDCASGVVWNTDAIASVTLVEDNRQAVAA